MIISPFYRNTKKIIFIFLILPVFIFSQLLSVKLVKRIQRYRSEKIISEIEKIKEQFDHYPTKFETKMGVEYQKEKSSDNYKIQYSIGFLVCEEYNSGNKSWQRQ